MEIISILSNGNILALLRLTARWAKTHFEEVSSGDRCCGLLLLHCWMIWRMTFLITTRPFTHLTAESNLHQTYSQTLKLSAFGKVNFLSCVITEYEGVDSWYRDHYFGRRYFQGCPPTNPKSSGGWNTKSACNAYAHLSRTAVKASRLI